MVVDKYVAIVEKQEEMLRFLRFNRRDARPFWDETGVKRLAFSTPGVF